MAKSKIGNPIHPFERAGLGSAPFRCVGWYESKYQAIPGDPSCPVQPGSSCDYCGQGIVNVFVIRSADGREFKVGCDCVARTARDCASTDVERDARRVLDQVNRLKTKAANARKDAAIALAMAKLDANAAALDRDVELFGSQRNALEYLRWMFSRAGRTGKAKAAKLLDKLLAGSQR
jgi:hypothetical protein